MNVRCPLANRQTVARNRMQGHYGSLSSRKHGTLDQLGMSRRKPLEAFTSKRLRFLNEYFRDFNATQAAIRAGYSQKTAYQNGSGVLKNVEVAQEVNRRKQGEPEIAHVKRLNRPGELPSLN